MKFLVIKFLRTRGLGWFLILFLNPCFTCLGCNTDKYTLMLTPEEIKDFLRESSPLNHQPKIKHGLYFAGIIFKTGNDWVIWLNDKKLYAHEHHKGLEILEINPNYIQLIWTIRNESHKIILRPNQTFDADSKSIFQGDCRMLE